MALPHIDKHTWAAAGAFNPSPDLGSRMVPGLRTIPDKSPALIIRENIGRDAHPARADQGDYCVDSLERRN